ncbi:hypothetical protein [Burkholderia contaminans]|uniref:hypothetical protein n=1 Tax=Burkholderia contaminans TaxID=488447 RepID=UPI0015820FF6|nr:hypothetical protein [Burkholderia contaminans]
MKFDYSTESASVKAFDLDSAYSFVYRIADELGLSDIHDIDAIAHQMADEMGLAPTLKSVKPRTHRSNESRPHCCRKSKPGGRKASRMWAGCQRWPDKTASGAARYPRLSTEMAT